MIIPDRVVVKFKSGKKLEAVDSSRLCDEENVDYVSSYKAVKSPHEVKDGFSSKFLIDFVCYRIEFIIFITILSGKHIRLSFKTVENYPSFFITLNSAIL